MNIFSKLFSLGNAKTENKSVLDLKNATILDVRTKEEFKAGHVTGAVNIDFYASNFAEKLQQLDHSKTYVLYCRSGNRSGQATRLMKQLGFKNAENLGSLAQASRKLGLAIQ